MSNDKVVEAVEEASISVACLLDAVFGEELQKDVEHIQDQLSLIENFLGRKAMSGEIKTKTIMFGDFDKRTTETLCNIIDWEFSEEGIEPYSYAFHIEVEYTTGEKSDE